MNAASATEASHRPDPLRLQLFLFSAIIGFFFPVLMAYALTQPAQDGGWSVVVILIGVVSLALLAANAAKKLSLQGRPSTIDAGVGLGIPSVFLVLVYGTTLAPTYTAEDSATLTIAITQLAVALLLILPQARIPRPLAVFLHRSFPKRFALPPTPESIQIRQPEGQGLQRTARDHAQAMLGIIAAAYLLFGAVCLVGLLVFLPPILADLRTSSTAWTAPLAIVALVGLAFMLLRLLRRSHRAAGTMAAPVLLLVASGGMLLWLSRSPASAPLPSVIASLLTLVGAWWYLRARRSLARGPADHGAGSTSASNARPSDSVEVPASAVPPHPTPKPWSPTELWLAYAIIPALVYALIFAFGALAYFLSWGLESEPSVELIELACIEAEFLGLWIMLLYLVRRKGHPWSIVGLKPFPLRTLLVIPVSYFTQSAALASFTAVLLPTLPALQSYSDSLDPYFEPSGVAIGLALLSTVVVAPVVEEILFRGFLFTGFRSYIGPVGAAVVTAVLFSLAHTFPLFFPFSLNLSPIQAVSTFLGGLVLAGLRHDSDSVFPSMLAHAAWNFMVGF